MRVLVVVAHPDDETLGAGGLVAWFAQHADVMVVTATRGERGEVIGEQYAALADDPHALGAHRETELAAALRALGVRRHLFLDALSGGAHFTDSGMQWADASLTRAVPADDAGPTAFSTIDLNVTAGLLSGLIDTFDPDLVVTEEPAGGYGHPDHIRAHEVSMRAVELADHTPPVAWIARPEEDHRAALRWLRDAPGRPTNDESGAPLTVPDPDGPVASIVTASPDVVLDVSDLVPQVAAAMRAHATQVHEVHVEPQPGAAGGWFALSNNMLQPIPVKAALRAAGDPEAVRGVIDELRGRRTAEAPRWYAPAMGAFALVLGVLLGTVGTVFHRVNPPIGVAVALLALVAGGALARAFANGVGVLLAGLGSIAMVFLMSYVHPGGDLIVTNETVSWVWVIGALVAPAIAALLPRAWFRDL